MERSAIGGGYVRRLCTLFVATILFAVVAGAQQITPPAASTPPTSAQSAEFLQAADEVLAEMSKLISLPIRSPLKKSLRSRDEIKAYLLEKMKEDKDANK